MQSLIKILDTTTRHFNSSLNEYKADLYSNRYYFTLLGILGLSAYGLLAFNPIFVADFWSQLFENEAYGVLGSGRWMMGGFWCFFFNNLFSPSFTTLSSFILISLSSYSIAKSLGIYSNFEKFVFASLIVFCPILTPHFAIYTHQLPFALAFILQAVITSSLNRAFDDSIKSKARYYFYIIFSQSVILGVRQEFLFLSISMIFATWLYNSSSQPGNLTHEFKRACKSFLVIAVGILLYYAIWKYLLSFFGTTPYLIGYYSVDDNLSNILLSLSGTVPRALNSIYLFYFFDTPYWPIVAKMVFLMIVLSTGILVSFDFFMQKNLSKPELIKNIFVTFIIYVAIILSPWLVCLAAPKMLHVTHTALIGLAPAYAILICYSLKKCRDLSVMLMLKTSALFIIITFTIFQNYAYSSISLRNKREFFVGSKILASIDSHDDSDTFLEANPQIVFFLGQIERNDKKYPFYHQFNNAMGWSIVNDEVTDQFLWKIRYLFKLIDTDQAYNKRKFYEYSLKNGESRSDAEKAIRELASGLTSPELNELLRRLDQTPIWPNKKSIVFEKNYVFVKLSKYKNENYSDGLKKLISR